MFVAGLPGCWRTGDAYLRAVGRKPGGPLLFWGLSGSFFVGGGRERRSGLAFRESGARRFSVFRQGLFPGGFFAGPAFLRPGGFFLARRHAWTGGTFSGSGLRSAAFGRGFSPAFPSGTCRCPQAQAYLCGGMLSRSRRRARPWTGGRGPARRSCPRPPRTGLPSSPR